MKTEMKIIKLKLKFSNHSKYVCEHEPSGLLQVRHKKSFEKCFKLIYSKLVVVNEPNELIKVIEKIIQEAENS